MSWILLAENEPLPNNPSAGFKAFRLNGVQPAFTDSLGNTVNISTFSNADIQSIIGGSIAGTTRLSSTFNSGTGITTLDVLQANLVIASSQVTGTNAANGLAKLDASGIIPSSILPAYVDDVLEFANLAAFPATGESGKIYIALDTNRTYRWSGSVYVSTTDGGVNSFNTRTGVVTAASGDYTASQITNTPSGGIAANTVQAALNELDAEKQNALLTGYLIATGNNSILTTDNVIAALGKLEYKFGQRFKNSGDIVNSSNTTLTNLTAMTLACVAGKTYRGTTVLVFSSAATATGIAVGIAGLGGVVGTFTALTQMTSANPATNSTFSGGLSALGTLIISPTVAAAGVNYLAIINYVFVCTTSGQLVPTFRSEVNASAVTVRSESWSELIEV